MSRSLIAGLLAFGVLACGQAASKDLADQRGAGAGVGTAAVRPSLPTLPSGSAMDARIQDSISSRTNAVGDRVHAIVSSDVTDDAGQVVIPNGSALLLTITKLGPAKNSGQADGAIVLDATSVTVAGTTYDLAARVGAVPHTLKGRGITKSAVGNVAVGTAAGAVIGQLVGHSGKSTVIGGAIGAVAGGARAATVADRDVIVTPGTPITLTLTQSLKISAK